MVRHYAKIFVCVFVLSVVCERQSDGVFIVYPYKDGDIDHQLTTKNPVRKFGNEVQRNPKMLNDSNLHLVYPTYEDVIIMTSAPMSAEESDELDTTESSTEYFSDISTTTETPDSYTQYGDFALESKEESEGGTTTVGDIDSTTINPMITEIPIQTQKSPYQEPKLIDIIYEERGPKKTLRKRMFEASKFSRKYPSGLKINNDMKLPTTMSPKDAFKNWYRKTSRNKAMTVLEKLGTKKTVLKNSTSSTTEKNTSENVQRKRYNRTYKRKTKF